jgi:hypothetical protein
MPKAIWNFPPPPCPRPEKSCFENGQESASTLGSMLRVPDLHP